MEIVDYIYIYIQRETEREREITRTLKNLAITEL